MRSLNFYIMMGMIFTLLSCSGRNEGNTKLEQFAGKWKINFKKLPRVGDQSINATFEIKDTLLVGSFIDAENNNITFDKIEIEGNKMMCSYVWDGHKVNFNLASVAQSRDSLNGRFMKLFKVEAVRQNN